MLSCKDVAQRASAYLDGDLSLWGRFQMRLHLAMCNGCRHFVDQMRKTRDLTGVMAEVETLSEADDARISAILSQAHEGKRSGG